ncbi:hypothetical protein EV383_4420 [Pseudonocardia sediminis]|uniref:DUF6980 domain-containing protein n=1 Tax=Pseudonocardia sediminis TaxID=1397368 RepID=A0A4Q7V093_PSEST|nr:hypothetical protein [Pseudonocardia sediminis]RZT87495.1 hypothetical protein EV383_4420 [Pseudonocardia sediminis]
MTDPTYCCDMLRENATLSCGQHTTSHTCPDVTVVWSDQHQEFGLPVRDGGSSWIAIAFCPWCSADLPVLPCSCGGIGWVDDKNWSPDFRGDRRRVASGRVPCGFCNEGDWTKPDPMTDLPAASS